MALFLLTASQVCAVGRLAKKRGTTTIVIFYYCKHHGIHSSPIVISAKNYLCACISYPRRFSTTACSSVTQLSIKCLIAFSKGRGFQASQVYLQRLDGSGLFSSTYILPQSVTLKPNILQGKESRQPSGRVPERPSPPFLLTT